MSGEAPPAGSGAGEWRRTDPLGLIAGMLKALPKSIVPLIAAGVSTREWLDAAGMAAGVAAVLVAIWMGSWISWRRRRYRIGPDDIAYESGVIARAARSVPYDRIQDVALEEALVPRLMGLVEVRFETGAGGKDELTLAYVDRAEGERLRDVVRARQAGTELAEHGERAEAAGLAEAERSRVLFALTPSRLLLFGLFEFSLVVIAAVFGVAQQFDSLLSFNVWEPEFWAEQAGWSRQMLGSLGFGIQVAAVALALLALVPIGIATGLVRTALRDWSFVLEDTERGLRRRRGLLTRTDVVMPLHRVQALTVTTGLVRRRFGWHRLDLVSLASDATSSSHTVVPFGQREEIAPVAAVTGFALPGPNIAWRLPSRRHRTDGALLTAVPLLLIAGGVAIAGWLLDESMTLLPALLLPIVAAVFVLRQVFLWRYDRHALGARHFYVRRGWLSPRLEVASRIKLQSVEIRQGPIARRRGYADLLFGIAGGKLALEGVPLAEAQAIRAAVLDSIASVDFSQLSGRETGAEQGKSPGDAGALSDELASI